MKYKIEDQMNVVDSKNLYECLSCKETIYNSICPNCLFKAIKQWMDEKGVDGGVLDDIKHFMKAHKSFSYDAQECLICHRKSVYLCPYCFTEFVLNVLKKHRVSQNVLKEYIRFFNFDFGDLRQFGVNKNNFNLLLDGIDNLQPAFDQNKIPFTVDDAKRIVNNMMSEGD